MYNIDNRKWKSVPRTLGANATIFEASPSPMFVLAVTQKSYLRCLSNPDASWVNWFGGTFWLVGSSALSALV